MKYPFAIMENGDCFLIGNYSLELMQAVQGSANSFRAKNPNQRFAFRKVHDEVYVWKTEGGATLVGENKTGYEILKGVPLIDRRSSSRQVERFERHLRCDDFEVADFNGSIIK